MRKLITYLLVLGMFVLPKTQANVGVTLKESNLEKKVETNKIIDLTKPDTSIFREYIQDIKPPKYKLNPERCAKYVKLSAKKLFGKEYTLTNAWNMNYHNKIISEVKDSIDIYKLINQKKMLPGTIVGFKNPHSRYNNRKDEKGKKRLYTHVALYVGVNNNFEPEFIHQEGKVIKKSTLRQMYDDKFKPVVVLDETNKIKI